MNKFFAILLALMVVGCSPKTEVVDVYRGDDGISGVEGRDGDDGLNGANGHSLVSSVENVNGCECDEQGGNRLDIYLDVDDSLTLSEGDLFQNSLISCNGRNGLQGIQGLQGVQGIAGETGAQGPQGVPGEAGPQGVAGVPGPQGIPGPIGLTGAAGATGATGAQGIAGPVGPTGATGPQGAMGPQGPTGPAGALLQNYTLNSTCQAVGDGYYAKRSSTTVKLFQDLPGNSGSDCDDSGSDSNFIANIYAEHTSNGDASYWLTATRLAFNDNAGNLRVIKFN